MKYDHVQYDCVKCNYVKHDCVKCDHKKPKELEFISEIFTKTVCLQNVSRVLNRCVILLTTEEWRLKLNVAEYRDSSVGVEDRLSNLEWNMSCLYS